MRCRIATFQHSSNHHRVVALCVVCRLKQRHLTVVAKGEKLFERGRIGREFSTIRRREMRPAPTIMPELAADLIAWRNLLQPDVDCRLLARKPARPEAVDQDPCAVLRLNRIVDASKAYRVGSHPLWCP